MEAMDNSRPGPAAAHDAWPNALQLMMHQSRRSTEAVAARGGDRCAFLMFSCCLHIRQSGRPASVIRRRIPIAAWPDVAAQLTQQH